MLGQVLKRFFVLAAFGFCAPLVNAPVLAILTVRAPAALRPKVMTAVMTIAQVIGPLGFLAVGLALQHVGMRVLAAVVVHGPVEPSQLKGHGTPR